MQGSAPDRASVSEVHSPAAGLRPGLGGARSEHAAETLRLYAGDWARFARFCAELGQPALPAMSDVVVLFIQQEPSGRTALRRRVAAIDQHHRQLGLPGPGRDPVVRFALKQARAAAPRTNRAPPPSAANLRTMAERCPRNLAGLRDRALLLLLAHGLSRRTLVGLEAERLRFGEGGVRVSDSYPAVPPDPRHDLCPVRALEAWLRASDTRYGPVFRKVTRWGTVEPQALGADAVRVILVRRRPA